MKIKVMTVIMIIILVTMVIALVIIMSMVTTVQLLENTVSIFTLALFCMLLTMAVFPQWCIAWSVRKLS